MTPRVASPIDPKAYENEASRYLTVDGVRIHYRDEGPRDARVVLLMHGVLSSLHTWDGWTAALVGDHRVIRLDLPGFALSQDLPPEKYTPAGAARFVREVMKTLGVARSHVVGNSLGGLVASSYAALFPEAVDKLVLISPIGYAQTLPTRLHLINHPIIAALAQRIIPRALVADNVRQVYGDPALVTDATIDRYYAFLQPRTSRRSMALALKRIEQYAKTDATNAHVPAIKAPTLLLWGEKDRWVPVALVERWRKDLPDARVKTYPKLGHIAMEEHPELTAGDARLFFRE